MNALERRFWAKVERGSDGECWLWTGALQTAGYGSFRVGTRIMLAHRFAYEMLVGPIPTGLTIDHVRERGCVHRNCVNPAHMEAVTPRENTLRGPSTLAAINARKTHCDAGHAFDAANTRDDGRQRHCRACQREATRRYQARRRATA